MAIVYADTFIFLSGHNVWPSKGGDATETLDYHFVRSAPRSHHCRRGECRVIFCNARRKSDYWIDAHEALTAVELEAEATVVIAEDKGIGGGNVQLGFASAFVLQTAS